jgi:hypothetical protein
VDSREQLYRNWFDWVTTNLGRDDRLAGVAAKAATDVAQLGKGFNVAAKAATAAWNEAASANWAEKGRATRTEGRAALACTFGIALWLWPSVTAMLLIAGQPDNTGPVVGVGAGMLIAGLAAVPVFFLGAIVCGHWAIARIQRSGLRGQGYAIVGLVLGYAALPVALLGIVALFFAASMAGCYAVMC